MMSGLGDDLEDALIVKVSMVDTLRRHLRLRKKDRKARFFISKEEEDDDPYDQLRAAILSHWGWLPENFELRRADIGRAVAAGSGNGAIEDEGEDDSSSQDRELVVLSAESLLAAVRQSRERGVSPTFKLSASVAERRRPPPSKKVDPAEFMAECPEARMLSFYLFRPIEDPAALKVELERRVEPIGVLGSIYVAHEGVNAQLMVRSDGLQELETTLANIRALDGLRINLGDVVQATEVAPFHRFKVTHKRKVLQDGLAEELDLSEAETGEELSPARWHGELAAAEPPLLLDCRNWYESEVGRFEGAVPLNTNKFHESWAILEEQLKDVDPNRRVLTYCTGGIRCVKVGAYLTQKLGLRNVARLEHGIVGYKRWLEETSSGQEEARAEADDDGDMRSLFRGTNFVFDQRVGVKVTDDVLTDDPQLSLIYNTEGEEAAKLRDSVYHQTRRHERGEVDGDDGLAGVQG